MKRRQTTNPIRPRPSRADVILYQLNSAIEDEPPCEELGPSFCVNGTAVKRPPEGET
jgi:hypothetical protein